MAMILDAGAFVALERNERQMWRRLKSAQRDQQPPMTHGGIVAQVWRGGAGRQALLSRALRAVDIVGLDEDLGRSAGVLLAASDSDDAIDAALAALAREGDRVVTSDPDDLAVLVEVTRRRVDVIAT